MCSSAPARIFGMKTSLRRGQNITPRLNSPGAQKYLPMGRSGNVIERGWHGENLCARLCKTPVQMRKPHIIANGQSDITKRRFGKHRLRTGAIAL